jgi:multidrug transporter EmrE-like cation transporter
MIPARTMILILGAVAFSALGQIFLKAGARHLANLDRLDFLLAALRSVHVLSGLTAWTASTICWLFVLQVAPLSRAYLLSSLTYVLIPVAGLCVFGERLRHVHVVGMCLILMGVACLMSGD